MHGREIFITLVSPEFVGEQRVALTRRESSPAMSVDNLLARPERSGRLDKI